MPSADGGHEVSRPGGTCEPHPSIFLANEAAVKTWVFSLKFLKSKLLQLISVRSLTEDFDPSILRGVILNVNKASNIYSWQRNQPRWVLGAGAAPGLLLCRNGPGSGSGAPTSLGIKPLR